MQNQELEPSVEVTHLRRLLDTQPSCLMRLGADGTVLAANDAALALLGVPSGSQALGRDFSTWVASDQRERWKAFSTGVVHGHAASIECDIVVPAGDLQLTLFHGVPLGDHPDGEASMAVSARAMSGQRHLEDAVVGLERQLREYDAASVQARARLAEAESRGRELEEQIALLEGRLEQCEIRAADDGQVRELTAELEARSAALAEVESARRAAEAKAAAALDDVRQLEVALDGFAARQKQVAAERATERQRLEELTASMAAGHEQELEAARNLAERERLAAVLQEREDTVRTLEAACAETRADLAAVQGAREHFEHELQIAQQALSATEQRERTAEEECRALAARLGEAEAACGEREASLRQLETAHASLAASHAALSAEHSRLVGALREQAGLLAALAGGEAGGDGTSAASRAGAGSEEEDAE